MKKLMAAMAAVLLLSGCSWMDGSYVSVMPHVVNPVRSVEDTAWIRNYSQLLSALTDLVDSGQTQGIYSLMDYSEEQLQEELDTAVGYLTTKHPIGVYAVSAIDYAYSSGGSNSVLRVDVTYHHGRSEIRQIKTVRGMDEAEKAIATALRQFDDALVLQITDYADTDFVQLAGTFAAEHPEAVMEVPQVTCAVYPNRGSIRVVELHFHYQTDREDMKNMQEDVLPIFSSAQLYISINAEDSVKYNQLYSFLTERLDYQFETSITPAYSLLCHGVGDSRAFARVYSAMCRQVGLECKVVTGALDGESRVWNMVRDGESWYHVDILSCMAGSGYRQKTDSQMQGYVWDYSAYPACGEKPEASAP